MSQDAEPRWRVGRKLGRTLYFNGVCVGMVDSAEMAEAIVAAMNGRPKSVVKFASEGDGGGPWRVTVDGLVVIEEIDNDDFDVSASALLPIWEAIGLAVEFDWDGKVLT